MLSKKEKQELLKDGLSPKRREEFSYGRSTDLKGVSSLDEYIQFLENIQRVFPPFPILRRRTITKNNKL